MVSGVDAIKSLIVVGIPEVPYAGACALRLVQSGLELGHFSSIPQIGYPYDLCRLRNIFICGFAAFCAFKRRYFLDAII
jgi:hypothetical protein